MGWALPGCNPNCPSNWINDGYCDKACNTPECDFDGNDCRKTSNESSNFDNARSAFANQSQLIFPGFYCSSGCSTSWLADKYCDNACNNKNCGFDLGDCGLNSYKEIHQINLNEYSGNEVFIELPTETLSFFINFTNLFANQSEFDVFKADYEENELIRKISIVNKFHILTAILMPNAYSENITTNPEQLLKIFIQFKQKSENVKITEYKIFIRLNSFLKKNPIQIISNSDKNLLTRPKNKTIQKNSSKSSQFSNLKPQYINKISTNNGDSFTEFIPEKIIFSNKLFKNVYTSYYNYLNWSLTNEFITLDGFFYKLKKIHVLLNSNINETYNQMIENLDSQDVKESYSLIYDLLLNANNNGDIFTKLDQDSLINEYAKNSSNNTLNEFDFIFKYKKRKLLDTFADSLRHVNRLYNEIYGYMARKVPAHMPHFIDKNIMNSLQEKFSSEFEKTSANRLRTKTDMQYAFSYYYFVISELEVFDADRLFDEIDLNMNDYLDESELFLISLKLSTKPFSSNKFVPHEASANDMYIINKEMINLLNECKENKTQLDNSSR